MVTDRSHFPLASLAQVDVKVQNDPERLFRLIHETISAQDDWQTTLAPRIVLGLWHPKFIEPAKSHLPYLKRSHIGKSVTRHFSFISSLNHDASCTGISCSFAKRWFWESCEVFSMSFWALATTEGEAFRKDCLREGKAIMVWTVNSKEEMMHVSRALLLFLFPGSTADRSPLSQCIRWGVQVVLTDYTRRYLDLREELCSTYNRDGLFPFSVALTTLSGFS